MSFYPVNYSRCQECNAPKHNDQDKICIDCREDMDLDPTLWTEIEDWIDAGMPQFDHVEGIIRPYSEGQRPYPWRVAKGQG